MGVVKGNKNGLVSFNNMNGRKSEPLVTIEKLKDTWLFGVHIVDRNTGEEMSDEAYQNAIDTAVSLMEHYLDISISPVKQFLEYKDHRLNDYAEWGYFQLDNYPVHCINSIKLVYFRDQAGEPIVAQEIPSSWIRLDNHDGIVRLVPNNNFPSGLQIGSDGQYYPEILKSSLVPHAWQFNYDYGFCTGNIPVLLNQAISMIAAIQMLITAGHLILGAGIAGTSISLDGLSQAIQTTQSAENSGFSSTIKDISDKLFGKTKDDPFAIMRILKDYYKGPNMSII